ncbi:MAG: hypothetical protein V3V67_13975 [Myxococcota bacterium]
MSAERTPLETIRSQHFAVEEEGGYFADILKVAPRLSRRTARLELVREAFMDDLGRGD